MSKKTAPSSSSSTQKKNFIFVNDGFICENCQITNDPLKGGCRNHCRQCLFSKHVDLTVPGDRLSECQGLMKPIKLEYNGKKGYIIVHECQKCGKIIKNKTATDDNFELIIKLTINN